MLDVPRRFGSASFQSNDVSGAQNSLCLFCHSIKSNSIRGQPQQQGLDRGLENSAASKARDVHSTCKHHTLRLASP